MKVRYDVIVKSGISQVNKSEYFHGKKMYRSWCFNTQNCQLTPLCNLFTVEFSTLIDLPDAKNSWKYYIQVSCSFCWLVREWFCWKFLTRNLKFGFMQHRWHYRKLDVSLFYPHFIWIFFILLKDFEQEGFKANISNMSPSLHRRH